MSRVIFAGALLTGAAAVVWMCTGFIGSDILALAVTLVIGGVYILGFVELWRFRQATATLAQALEKLPADNQQLDSLDSWLESLHHSIRNAVRLRIEGERAGLPAPVLTPYLVGLLVMLGLLGTFVGMIDTLHGAVTALEGSTELLAIRAGLTAPIQGLGLAFGTSVAGVAASAMLGLASTISRRDRMLATRLLDGRIGTVLRHYSLAHNRQETYRALQQQAQALPAVAQRLDTLAASLEHMGEKLSSSLADNQQAFHHTMQNQYRELAKSVDRSLHQSLADSGRNASEAITPLVQQTMQTLCTEARNTQQQLQQSATTQLDKLGQLLQENAVTSSRQFEQTTDKLVTAFVQHNTERDSNQAAADRERLQLWANTLEQTRADAASQLSASASRFADELGQLSARQADRLGTVTETAAELSKQAAAEWQLASNEATRQQQQSSAAIEANSSRQLAEASKLLLSAEELLNSRIATEQRWLEQHDQRIHALTDTMENSLTALRDAEAARGQAATDRLAELENTVSQHLARLGNGLEQPIKELIVTASEAPRAAAELIGHLNQEISNNMQRDNQLLTERQNTLEQLAKLAASLEKSTTGQQQAVEKMVSGSLVMLQQVGQQFSTQVHTELEKVTCAGSDFAASAADMAALGDGFAGAVARFNDSNDQLIERLGSIETAMNQATDRSDEQMGYYVAQARDIIDQSLINQKEIFEQFQQLGQYQAGVTA